MTTFTKINDTFTIEIKSNGPYITFNYLKILNNTNINIIWKKYINSGYDNNIWIVDYETINLGDFTIYKNSIIDMINKFASHSKIPHRSLKINDTLINENQYGTSCDKYIITFLKETNYKILNEYYIDK